jgi:pimeloyl-ACP methyl ester carboxylesterase
MTSVFVHGVPETPAVWDPVRSQLARDDVVAVPFPGYGAPRPTGFGATMEEYVDWLVAVLEGVQSVGPVVLVGHDWGGAFVVRVVSTRPDLVRCWVTDAGAVGDDEFEWHEFAKIWQTPDEGEEFFKQQLALSTEDRASVFEMFGVPHDEALTLAGGLDQEMADSILALYRSAVDVGRQWAPDFHDMPAPGMIVVPSEDPFLSAELARKSADRAGATVTELDGLGHWWMLQDPARGASMLEAFWAGVG